MKKIITLFILFAPAVLQAQTGNFTVKGKLPAAAADFKKIYFGYSDGKGWKTDSLKMKDGTFAFSGTIYDGDLQQGSLSYGNNPMKRNNDDLQIFIGKGDHLEITATAALKTAEIKGSPESVTYRDAQLKLNKSDSPDEWITIIKSVIEQYPDSRMSFNTLRSRFGAQNNLTQQFPTQIPAIYKLYNMLSPRIKATKEGVEYGEHLERLTHLMVGGALPDFSAKTPEGKTVKLSDFKGKYVLVDFWASWCIPCRAEFPFLKKAYARFKSKNFEIVGYSIDNDKSLWVSALENDDVPWMNVSMLKGYQDPTAVQYAIRAVPSNFLIGPDGKVIAVNLRGESVEPKLEQLIK